MDCDWFECTKIVAYYLWENTKCDNALSLWHCAEDIASFFVHANITEAKMINSIQGLGVGSEGYAWFVRNIAYRLHLYTHNTDELNNWFLAEELLASVDWVQSLTAMASMLRAADESAIRQVRSDTIRNLYGSQTF
ncbi:MAG: hypothetical protein FWC91_06715 [Defluviitaleaceae bacterium]|nr:hypothetical protein [Defluviitaleaceae bacterium]